MTRSSPARSPHPTQDTCSDYNSIDYGAFSYFLVACLIFLACGSAYLMLERNSFAQYWDLHGGDSTPEPRHASQANSSTYNPLGEDAEKRKATNEGTDFPRTLPQCQVARPLTVACGCSLPWLCVVCVCAVHGRRSATD